jgi:hypothetical protein
VFEAGDAAAQAELWQRFVAADETALTAAVESLDSIESIESLDDDESVGLQAAHHDAAAATVEMSAVEISGRAEPLIT